MDREQLLVYVSSSFGLPHTCSPCLVSSFWFLCSVVLSNRSCVCVYVSVFFPLGTLVVFVVMSLIWTRKRPSKVVEPLKI